MNLVAMNDGSTIACALIGSVLHFGDPAFLTLDLAELEADTERVVTVYADGEGALTLAGGNYVAIVVIPPRRYALTEVEEDGMDGPVTVTKPVAQPLNTDAVTVKLWALPEPTPHQEA